MSSLSSSQNPIPPVNFSQFVVSLASSALVHLGEIAEPGTTTTNKNLRLAGHTLNVLQMLHDKTNGNLDADESKLMHAILTDIQGKYETAAS